jgi:hypothetical protein
MDRILTETKGTSPAKRPALKERTFCHRIQKKGKNFIIIFVGLKILRMVKVKIISWEIAPRNMMLCLLGYPFDPKMDKYNPPKRPRIFIVYIPLG